MTTPVSETIYASRDAIRAQVIEFLQQYMELDEVDLTQSSFLSYIIDIFTTLASNLMFYQSNIYREFFLTQAQLPESIHNLSSFLGYSPKEATNSIADLLMTVNLPFDDLDSTFNIPSGFEFQTADGVVFTTYYDTLVTITNNTSVTITNEVDGKVYDVPVAIDTTSDDQNFQFIMPTKQYQSTVQEFQLDDDLQPFQFTDINVPIDGKVADIAVYVKDPDASSVDTGRLYTQFNSLYLMSSSDYGYVLRVSPEGRRIYFGNGIIGQQPLPGSTIVVYVNVTEGEDGNSIAGSITSGGRIYTQQTGVTTIVDYDVINAAPAYNGEDEEDLQEIRSNSIKSLVSLNRLVSETDYENFDVIIPDAPIRKNSIPVLKRSDLKVNEIQLYTVLEFGDDLVPSRNVFTDKYKYYSGDVWHEISSSTTYLPRNIIIKKDEIEYITLFEMTLDQMNEAAYYHYIMREINIVPTLIESWSHQDQDLYHFNINNLNVKTDDATSEAIFELSYYSNESDFDLCECEMKIVSEDAVYVMTNVPTMNKFVYIFPDYLTIPEGEQTYYFTITNQSLPFEKTISQYSTTFVFRQDLKSYMMSNTVDDGTTTIIYDIPVVLNSYYTGTQVPGTGVPGIPIEYEGGIDKVVFETQVLQSFLSSFSFKNYRMLTDFINIKFCNTTGLSTNMLKNTPTKQSVDDLGLTYIPIASLGDKYIVSGNEGGQWTGHDDEIAMCIDSTAQTWSFLEPIDNDIVYITNKASNYIYSEYGWKRPIYDIPLKISLEVFKINDSSIEEGTLIANIKEVIIDYYEEFFGDKIDIRRSKIIDLVHNVYGVSHCRLLKPSAGVFFDFDIDDFTQDELLEYTPEWIYFKEEDISIKIFNAG